MTNQDFPVQNLFQKAKVFFKKNGRLFSSFQIQITIFTTNKCEKSPSSIQCWNSNPWPSEHESPPVTTRPGLPPTGSITLFANLTQMLRKMQFKCYFCLSCLVMQIRTVSLFFSVEQQRKAVQKVFNFSSTLLTSFS